jgi:hypothetical protein
MTKKSKGTAPTKQRTRLDAIAKRVDRLLNARTRNAVELGKELSTGRVECEKTGDEFLVWLSERFDMSKSTAYNYMNAADYVKRFPTVGNANLAPTVLYALANGDYDEQIAELIRKAGRTQHVGPDRAHQIEAKWQSEHSALVAPETETDTETDTDTDEIEQALAKPPDVPPPEPAPRENLLLPEFEKTLKQAETLSAKPPEIFADTKRAPSDLRNLGEKFNTWLNAVSNVKQQAAAPAIAPAEDAAVAEGAVAEEAVAAKEAT